MGRARALVNFNAIYALIARAVSMGGVLALAAVPRPAFAEPAFASEGFVVVPFHNQDRTPLLRPLEVGLPAILAERFASYAPLGFVGPPLLVSVGEVQSDARYQVSGSFARAAGMQLRIEVVVHGLGGQSRAESGSRGAPGRASAETQVLATGEATGARDEAAALALRAAKAAFASIPGLRFGPEPSGVDAPFGRDGYAFLWYARGLEAALAVLAAPGAPEHGRALSERQRAQLERAIEALGRSLVIDPKVPETRRLLGHLHARAGRPGHARTQLATALDLRPEYVLALRALCALDRAAGEPGSLAATRRLVALDPGDLDARRALGELLYEQGELDEAAQVLESVLALRPHDLSARRTLTLVLSARRAGAALVRELEEVVRLDPTDVDARMDLAAAYLAAGREPEAASIYDEVLQRQPRHPAALKFAGDLARKAGRLESAVARYQALRRVAPEDPRPVFLLGVVYAEAGNTRAARRMFEEASAFAGWKPEAYANLGALALNEGDVRQARWFLERAVRFRPDYVTGRVNHALALRAQGRPAEALGEIRLAQQLAPGDAGIRFLAGVINLRLGLLQAAADDFRATLEREPGHAHAADNLELLLKVLPSGGETLSLVPAAHAPVSR